MGLHRFTVNVPNPTAHRVVAALRLVRTDVRGLEKLGLRLGDAELEVARAGIARDPCEREPAEKLEVELDAHESVDVHILVETGGNGIAAFHLVDARADAEGGVLVVCVEPAPEDPQGERVESQNPCPLVLAGDVYAVDRGTDPSLGPGSPLIPRRAALELVAPIVSPEADVSCAEVYLEHLGLSDAEYAPVTWSIGALAAGEVFYAAWPLNAQDARPGNFEASIVVASADSDAVRLGARLVLEEPHARR